MAAAQATDVIVIVDCVQADGTSIAGIGKEFSRNGGLDLIDVFFVFLVCYGVFVRFGDGFWTCRRGDGG